MIVVKLSAQDIRRYNGYIWKFFGGCFLLLVLLIVATYLGVFGALPSFRDLENPKSNQASEIITSDKQVLGTYYVQNRSSVTYKEISPNVINALVATEDERFFEHSGIDFRRMFSILFLNLFKRQGGSTITQQLALNLFSERSHNKFVRFTQKMKEWITAVQLERHYTKQEIITMYLNTVDFGAYNTFGIKSAARTYFNTTPDKLTPDQAAMLIAMINGPGYYSPINHPDRVLNRRNNVVLTLMKKMGFLTEGQLAEYKAKPLGLDFNPITHNDGPAPYFRMVLKREVQKILKDESITKADGTPYDLDRDGLKIYTTINYTMQDYAEEAQAEYMRQLQVQFNGHWKGYSLYKSIKNFKLLLEQGMHRSDRYKADTLQGMSKEEIEKDFNTPTQMELFTWKGDTTRTMKPIDSIVYSKLLLRNSMMSMDPTTGYIKAWVGGINHKYFKYDHVRQGTRQPGSTFKPFVYGTAIEAGFSPCMQLLDISPTIKVPGGTWTPFNSDGTRGSGAKLNLRQAMARSLNSITAQLIAQVEPKNVVNFAQRLGITSKLEAVPSLCLGTSDVSLYEMVAAYCSFVNLGLRIEPYYITRIEDKNGNVLDNFVPKTGQAMDEKTAYKMIYMLQGGVEDVEGTSRGLSYELKVNNEIGGKTGTTDNASDGWYMGVTHNLVTGAWVGGDERSIHFPSWSFGQGGKSARPIWDKYMMKVYRHPEVGVAKGFFKRPASGLDGATLDCSQFNIGSDSTYTDPNEKPWDPNQP